MPLTFEPVSGTRFRLTVEAVRAVSTPDFFSGAPLDLPVAIAELGIPGLRMLPPAPSFATECRDDLVRLGDVAVPVRLTGTAADLERRDGLAVEACSPLVDLPAGSHELRSASGRRTGIDVDRLVLRAPPTGLAASASSGRTTAPKVRVVDATRTSFQLQIDPSASPSWLVLGQSHNLGWRATLNGRRLVRPLLVDGYANGWRLPPTPGGPSTVRLEWVPQRNVWAGLALSGLALLLCLAIVVVSSIRRRPVTVGPPPPEPDPPSFLRPEARRPLLVAPLIVGVGFSLAAGPVVGIPSGALVGLAIVVPWARWLVAFGGALALAASGTYVALQQLCYDYPPDFAWPTNTEKAHLLGWLAVALATAAVLSRREGRDKTPQSDVRAEDSLKSRTAVAFPQ